MKSIKLIAIVLGLFMVVGCSSAPKKLAMRVLDPVTETAVDAYASATTVKDSTDRSVTFDQLGVKTDQVDERGDPVFRAIATQRTVGDTTAGRSIQGMTAGVGAAATQGYFFKEAAKIKADAIRCPEGVEVCNSTILQGATAQSISDSVSGSSAGASAVVGCNTGQCAAPPSH
jgi:hypothetical protein